MGDMEDDLTSVRDKGNELAREFYRLQGYVVPEGYRFDKATHPQESRCWDMAHAAFDMLTGTDLTEICIELEEDEDGQE
jgi:hypothetical protein